MKLHPDWAHRNGNLFIKLYGAFDNETAQQVTRTIDKQAPAAKKIFINTQQVDTISDQAATQLRNALATPELSGRLYFIGAKGTSIGPAKAKVIIPPPKKKCCGRCKKKSLSNQQDH